MKNLMRSFALKERTTTYFRDIAIYQIKIRYRIMEYLNPDKDFMPKNLNNKIKAQIDAKLFDDAAENIMRELCVDIDSSSGYESIKDEAVDLLECLYEEKNQKELNEKKKRRDLLKELNKLNKDLGYDQI